ncbi:MAG TPA: thrombospondin type 3 repeat-containing protein [Polyangiales bacterium]
MMLRIISIVSAVLAVAGSAHALPDYPEALQKASAAPCLPHCNVCHRDDNAGSGTVDRPFGRSMERIGGLGGAKAGVAWAVQTLEQQGTDSDGDGVPDIEELAMGEDPNDAHPTSLCGPEAGCSLRPSTREHGLLALGLALWILRRRRQVRG